MSNWMAGLQDLDLSLTGVDHLDQHGRRGWQARDTCNGEAWGARVNPMRSKRWMARARELL